MQQIQEHSTIIQYTAPVKDVHAKMAVFYNPLMKSNRNLSILLLNTVSNTNMNIALPLAGSGIRALRFFKELQKRKINHLFVNDKKENFVETFTQNLTLNGISDNGFTIRNEEASLFLLNQINSQNKPQNFCGFFDYIDLDPFGSPNPFLGAAIARLTREGILAVTATDTAALTGTYPKVTPRKYWAKSLKNHLMHEIGLRILIRKIQLHGIQFDKALVPLLAYHKDHYFRIYFRVEKGKNKCDALIKQHQFLLFNPKSLEFKISPYNKEDNFDYAGPLWTGSLTDRKIINTMCKSNPFPEEQKFLDLLREESSLDVVGFHDLHALAKKYKLDVPKIESVLKKVNGVRTHFSGTGIKTPSSFPEVIKVLQGKNS